MNESIYAIFLSSSFIFGSGLLPSLWNKKSLALRFTIISILVSVVIIYFNFQGRAAVIGTSVSIIYLLFSSKVIPKKTLLFTVLTGLIILLIVIFYFVKRDSSNGRLLIYKIVFTQLKPKDFISGIGVGKFKAKYNQLQAIYFETNNRNSKEALLAGNGYYLFNDWLQFTLEIGIIGLLLITLLIFLLFKFFYWKPNNKPILIAANASLLCIGTAAFFSYPLQVPATLTFFVICLCIHFYRSWSIKEKYNTSSFRLMLRIASIAFFIFLFSYAALIYWYNKQANLAFELNRDGFKKDAEKIFKDLIKYPVDDYNTRYNYAYLLYFKNDLQNALVQLDKSLSLAYSTTSVKLKADILAELNNYKDAEYYYRQAVYITPGRMIPKLNLVQFYIKTNQTENIKYWANDIITMPVKIPSETTQRIQAQAKEILKKYSQ